MAGPAGTKVWTTRTLLAWVSNAFEEAGLDSPRLSAELLMSAVISQPRLKLFMDPDRPATEPERERLRDLTRRALRHEPIQYLVGEAYFFGLEFRVDHRVLIPRPCTELLVEHVLQGLREGFTPPAAPEPQPSQTHSAQGDAATVVDPGPAAVPADASETAPLAVPIGPRGISERDARSRRVLIADVCTGSGCIAVALAKNLPNATVIATDISPGALDVARENVERHGVHERVRFVQGDGLGPLLSEKTKGRGIDVLVTNPPYIPDDEWGRPAGDAQGVGMNVKGHEPEEALRGGGDGLRVVRPILEHAHRVLAPGGSLLMEHAAAHADAVRAIAEQSGLVQVQTISDHEGHPRVLSARRGG